MALNWETNDTFRFVDKTNHIMLQNRGGDQGRGDAIGGCMDAYFAYEDERFIGAIRRCWRKIYTPIYFLGIPIKKYFWEGKRHPTSTRTDLSRDHVINTVSAYKLAGMSDENLQKFVKHIPWRISGKFTFTLDAWLSIRVMAGMPWARFLFYLIEIPLMFFVMLFNKLIYKIAGFKDEVPQHEYVHVPNDQKGPNFFKYVKYLFPVYALGNLCMQLYVSEDTWGKKILRKILRKMVLKHNYFQKMLLKDKSFKPTKENEELVYGYKSMIGGRWSTSLNEVNDRYLVITDEKLAEYNAIDEDIIRKLFEEHKKLFE